MLQLFWTGRKIVQNGKTEQKQGCTLLLVTRRCMLIHREAKFFHSIKHDIFKKFVCKTNFYILF